MRRLRRSQLPADTVELARFLLGMTLVSDGSPGRCAVRIVETEAYVVGDAASHAFRGPTPRTASMYLRRGHAYVYFIYGTAFCINVSSEAAGVGAAVLLRAGEPVAGVDIMRARRGVAAERDLCRGPGRLAAALGVTRLHDGLDLCAAGPLWLADRAKATSPQPAIGASVRIGLTKEAGRVLRFFERGNEHVSGPAKLNRNT